MNKLLLLISFTLLTLFSNNSYSQLTCGATFTDSGGANGNYANNENTTYNICPSNSTDIVTLTFTSFSLENGFDHLMIYDGTSINAPLLANLTGSTLPNQISSSFPGGCLTVVFTSDGSVVNSGWSADVSCAPAPTCPAPTNITSTIVSSNSIALSWTENGSASQWEIQINAVGGIITNANPYLFTSLTPGTSYVAQVRAICSGSDSSFWSNPFTFTTPPCVQPTQIVASNITTSSANFAWVDANATSWQVAVQLASITTLPTTGTLTTNNTNYLASGLQPGTAYNVYVRNDCGIGTFNIWSNPTTFTTALPPPVCGGQFIDNGGINGNYANGSDNTYTICPQNAGDLVTVTFTSFDTEANWDGLYVFNGNSITSPQIASTNGSGNVPGGLAGAYWGTTIPGPFTSSAPNGCLTFRFRSDTSVNKPGWVANVTCQTQSTCPMPSNIVVTQSAANEALINWTETGTATQWEVNISSNTNTTGQSYFTTQANYLATNLVAGEIYIIKVRAICSTTDMSNWIIYTYVLPTCLTPTNVTATSISPNGATVGWTNNGDSTQWEILVLPAGSPVPTATTTGGVLTTNNPYLLNGLTASTTYDVYVRAICNFSSNTSWTTVTTFTTSQYLPPLVSNTTYTPTQIVNSVLANNPCISITNVTSVTGTNFGSVNGIGTFTNTNPTFPMSSGIVLSTGNAQNVGGPNTTNLGEGSTTWTGDSQLENIITTATGQTMYSLNATKLEFDFTTLNEFMSFNFLFASEEYGTFQCTYSDAFAFLLTDQITGITTNLAVVPGTTTPVSVVTIRDMIYNTGCPSVNPGYFDVYNDIFSSATNFNGQTTVMTASSPLIPNHPYHIKLVVADRGDSLFDSAVFIEAGAFTAGPPQCTDKINLVAFIDANNNGIKDSGETDFSYGSFLVEQNNDGIQNNITSPIGLYTIYDSNTSNVYDFNFQINTEYAPYYSMGTVNYNDINIPLGSGTQTFYFPITLTQGYNDVTVSISSVTPPRPGFNYTNKIVYKNLGVNATSGTLNFVKDAAVSIVSVSQSGTVSNSNGFSYSFANLQPYETRMFNVTMSVPASPTVNLNDLLTNSATISAPSNDVNLNNNSFSNAQVVVASYDPNYVTESHGGKIQFNQFTTNDYLYYTIHFQNTGTANAINVRLENLLDSQLDENSIRMVSASHTYVMERIGNHITWRFDYINLVGALQSEELSQGFVTFKIKVKPGFAVGTIIPSVADIYFDTNPAITTNTFNTVFVSALGNNSFETNDFVLFPNPASENVSIYLPNSTDSINKITIYDMLGKTVKAISKVDSQQTSLSVSDLSLGVYMLEVETSSKLKISKKLVIK